MSPQIILYDVPTRNGVSWSLNPWKTRMVLNYKGIDYRTEWLEFPDLGSRLKSFGIPPNSKEAPEYFRDYTIPAIKYTNGTYAMDSWSIAQDLEVQVSSASLHLDNPIVERIRDHAGKMMETLVVHFVPKIPSVLNGPSAEYIDRAREQDFGAPLKEVEREYATEECWEKAKKPATEAGDWLRKNGGPFFLGETVSYADFIFVSMLHFFKRLDEGIFERYLALDPTFPRVYEACKQWLQKED
ncbi:hypothetical protein P153DRAFT_365107 [Dothidotthia symphoricarpi CBS 119687]|uniref:Uncharacterized protein n=1 Tax=Dothidotthia symphoricarpi CBS 119687 TaxID=1392245 RepID=A0A6A6AKA1_9PLEO|nr:uncharacterized protein P153DRAFT_365107 [Dothidotthia symphoricarpi CBS 119687]KAF2131525.1 hypothetical protein P153DRAFT_365107 [Dothidotthia symphoricarpi CBS 119687]